ncbi:MAG TPA: hypothetical protein VGM80_04700 [Gaiellaceae bacterium]
MSREYGVVGEVVAELVRKHLSMPRDSDEAPGAGAVVVSTFGPAEVRDIVHALEGFRASGQAEPVTVVVATNEHEPLIPGWARLNPSRSLTWHRNNNKAGLVLIELDEASDRQGLGQMFRLTDGSVLAPGDDVDEVLDLITLVAWRGGEPRPVVPLPPQTLSDALRRVFHGTARETPVSLRRWVAYVVQCCDQLVPLQRAVTATEILPVLGDCLAELALFPHPALFDDPARVERHLTRNVLLADLRNPQGKLVPEGFLTRRIDAIELLGADGAPLAGDEQTRIRELMRRFAEHVDDESRRRIDFTRWSLLFDAGSSRSGLGARVRESLAQLPERLSEFEELEIEAALDESDQEAAVALVDAEPRGDE